MACWLVPCFHWLIPAAHFCCDVSQAILSNEIDWDAPELQPLSAAARDFLERLLQRNPVLRPSAAEALEHPWLAVEGAANDMPLKVHEDKRVACCVVLFVGALLAYGLVCS
jgi:serine/threonine protein kinase